MNTSTQNKGSRAHHLRTLSQKLYAGTPDHARPIVLYDIEKPLKQRQDERLYFKSVEAAANFLCVHRHKVSRAVGGRLTAENGKIYAVREPKDSDKKM